MWELAKELFPICRSLTGQGVRDTLKIIQREIPIVIHSVPSGTRAFDWTVPDEWNIEDGWIEHASQRFCEFRRNNLHIMGYSTPTDQKLSLEALQAHLHSLPNQPDAIPYRTSYYNRNWGFCISDRDRQALPSGEYRAVIKATLAPGEMNYADLIIPGEVEDEILFSTYICHPSMANDQLSGPVVMVKLVKWLMSQSRYYTYRIVLAPETIGSIVYLSKHLDELKANVVAGFNLACLGNEGYSMVHSRLRHTLADGVAEHVLNHVMPISGRKMDYLQRGGDERQYCAPGIDLPYVALWRNVDYPQYHTSLDDLGYIKKEALEDSLAWIKHHVYCLEANFQYRSTMLCEPQMGKRGLYRAIGTENLDEAVRTRMDVLAYCDGRSALSVAHILGKPLWKLIPYFKELEAAGLIERTS